jgi:metal-responsive CopG/Arc/MetJ family transcriptional regulator
MGKYVEDTSHMVVQIVIGKKLLEATDVAARLRRSSRSAIVRDALREHLRRLEIRDQEDRDRRGYSRIPQSREETLSSSQPHLASLNMRWRRMLLARV